MLNFFRSESEIYGEGKSFLSELFMLFIGEFKVEMMKFFICFLFGSGDGLYISEDEFSYPILVVILTSTGIPSR